MRQRCYKCNPAQGEALRHASDCPRAGENEIWHDPILSEFKIHPDPKPFPSKNEDRFHNALAQISLVESDRSTSDTAKVSTMARIARAALHKEPM